MHLLNTHDFSAYTLLNAHLNIIKMCSSINVLPNAQISTSNKVLWLRLTIPLNNNNIYMYTFIISADDSFVYSFFLAYFLTWLNNKLILAIYFLLINGLKKIHLTR